MTGPVSSPDRGIREDTARRAPACALVIFGASGDLTERKLLPAIRQLAAHGRLPPEFALVGVARTAMSDEEWAGRCSGAERLAVARPGAGQASRSLPIPGQLREVLTRLGQEVIRIGERERIEMNQPELIRAAGVSGGKFYTPLDAGSLIEDLPRPSKVPLDTDPPIPLWNTWPVLALFLALITMEWVIRKRKQMV